MTRWRDMFVGREPELCTLLDAWAKAIRGSPQLVAVLAPPGLGKTRLVQQFFTRVAARDAAGYWPPSLGRARDRLALNCAPQECDPRRPMNYMWWAIKCVDGGHNYAASSDLHSAYQLHLKPNVEARRTDQQRSALRRSKLKAAGFGAAEIGSAIIEKGMENFPVIGPFVGLIKAASTSAISFGREYYRLDRESDLSERMRFDLAGHGARASADFESELMQALQNLAHPAARGVAACPIILVVDDAQFAGQDPALSSFLRRFMETAWSHAWPILIVLTHWTLEWRARSEDTHELPGLVTAARRHDRSAFTIIDLPRNPDLGPVLDAAVPGLPAGQRMALIDKAGGNAGYLAQLLQLLLDSPAFFEGGKPGGPIVADAMADILNETFDLHEITRRFFDSAPSCARLAAALASIQGERFSEWLLLDMARCLSVPGVKDGIGYCENPLSVFSGSQAGIREFAQTVFRDVALGLVPRLVGRGPQVAETHAHLLTEQLDRWDELRLERLDEDSPEDVLLLDQAIGLGGDPAASPKLRRLAMQGALRKGDVLANIGDLVGAQAAFDLWEEMLAATPAASSGLLIERAQFIRWLCLKCEFARADTLADELVGMMPRERDAVAARTRAIIQDVKGQAIGAIKGPAAELRVRRDQLRDAVQAFELAPGLLGKSDLAKSRLRFAMALKGAEGARRARVETELATRAFQELDEKIGSAATKQNLSAAKCELAEIVKQIEGPMVALPLFESALHHAKAGDAMSRTADSKGNLGQVHQMLGNVLIAAGHPELALPHRQIGVQLAREAFGLVESIQAEHQLALAHSDLSEVLAELHGPAAALPDARTAFEIAERIHRRLSTTSAGQLATLAGRLARLLSQLGDQAGARRYLEREKEGARLAVDQVRTPGTLRSLAVSLSALGDHYFRAGETDEAARYFDEALALIEELPLAESVETMQDLASLHRNRGMVAQAAGDANAARRHLEASAKLAAELCAHVDAPSAIIQAKTAETQLGRLLLACEGVAAARPHFEAALDRARKVAAAIDTPAAMTALAIAHGDMASLQSLSFDNAGALASLESTLDLCRQVVAVADTMDARHNLALAHMRLGHAHLASREWDSAAAHSEAGAELLRELPGSSGDAKAKRDLLDAILQLGEAKLGAGNKEAAKAALESGLRIARRLLRARPSLAAKRQLRSIHSRIGEFTLAEYGIDAARGHFDAARRLAKVIAEAGDDPADRRWEIAATRALADAVTTRRGARAGRYFRREEIELSRRLAETSGTSPDRLHFLCAVREHLKGELLQPDEWSRPFVRELPDRATARKLLGRVEDYAAEMAQWCAGAGADEAKVWLGGANMLLARVLLAAGEGKRALPLPAPALQDIREYVATRAIAYDSLADSLLTTALVERAVKGTIAEAVLDEALGTLAACPDPEDRSVARLVGVVHWFYRKMLLEDGRTQEAEVHLRAGLAAARRFARFGQQDGSAILRAFEDAASRSI